MQMGSVKVFFFYTHNAQKKIYKIDLRGYRF